MNHTGPSILNTRAALIFLIGELSTLIFSLVKMFSDKADHVFYKKGDLILEMLLAQQGGKKVEIK